MPATVAELLEHINTEVAFTVLGVKILDRVYIAETGKDTAERSAPGFFEVTGIALQRDIFLALARLTDPPRMGQFENISVRMLIDSLPASIDATVSSGLRAEVEELEKRAEPVREWRMKYIAHNDLEYGLGRTPLDTVSVSVVRDILERAGRIAEGVGRALTPENYRSPLGAKHVGGGERLLLILQKGLDGDDGHLGTE